MADILTKAVIGPTIWQHLKSVLVSL